MDLENVPLEKLALLIPTKAALYRILVKEMGYFLPEQNSKAITEEYLLGVLRGKFYSLKLSDKKEVPIKEDLAASKLELISEIMKKTNKNLGLREIPPQIVVGSLMS